MSEPRWRRGCPSDGFLRLMIDAPESDDRWSHVRSCERCEQRLAALRAVADATRIELLSIDADAPVNIDESYRRLRPRLQQATAQGYETESGGSWMRDVFSRRIVRASTAVVAAFAMVFLLALSPMRTVADDFFDQFRVQKFAAVTIPMDLIEPLNSGLLQSLSDTDKQQMKDELAELGTFDTNFNFDDLPKSGTVEEAQESFGSFATPEDLPDGFDSAPNAYVTEPVRASYELNVAKAQEIIDSMNLPIYELDNVKSPTLEFEANIPAAVVLEYQNAAGERVLVGQMKSPTLSFPDELNMNQLREEILLFPGLPTDLVAQLRAIDDWEHTLIIPIPEGADSDDVTINGEPGLVIEHELGSAIVWQKDDMLYAVVGQVSPDEIEDIADSMD